MLVDTAPLREDLAEAFAKAGIMTRGKTLSEVVSDWTTRQAIQAGDLPKHLLSRQALFRLQKGQLLKKVDFGEIVNAQIQELPFDGFRLEVVSGVHFTGSSAYKGGLKPNGRPAVVGLFEYNSDHPMTKQAADHLVAHEAFPGHYTVAALTDLQVQADKLGFEATIGTMCTPQTVFQEGFAEIALELLYGGDRANVIEALGPGQAVEYALGALEAAAKHNASIHHQRDRVDIETLGGMLSKDYCLPPALVKKMSGAWAKHPIVGPMYGPAYWVGSETCQSALQRYGMQRVIEVGFQSKGFVDLPAFVEKCQGD